MSNLFWLTEAQMARLEPFFPKSHGRPRVDDLRVLSGIVSINRNGLRWCVAPREYGPPKTLYNRWKRWSRMGVFTRIMTGLAAEAGLAVAITIVNVLIASAGSPLSGSCTIATSQAALDELRQRSGGNGVARTLACIRGSKQLLPESLLMCELFGM